MQSFNEFAAGVFGTIYEKEVESNPLRVPLFFAVSGAGGLRSDGFVDTALLPARYSWVTPEQYVKQLQNKTSNPMATTAKPPTQTQTNSALTTGLDTAMKYIDQLTSSFNTLKGGVIGAARAVEPAPNPTAPSQGMSRQTMLIIGAAVVVLLFVFRKKL